MDTITFSIPRSQEIILQAKHLCHDVYLQMGYIDKPFPGRTLPGYDGASTYIVATNKYGEVIGTISVSRQVPHNFFEPWNGGLFASCKSLINNALHRRSFIIGSLAVEKTYAGLHIAHDLYRMAYEWALWHNLTYGIISMDHRAFRALKMAGWYAIQVGEPAWYLGSPTIPAIIPIREQAEASPRPSPKEGGCCVCVRPLIADRLRPSR